MDPELRSKLLLVNKKQSSRRGFLFGKDPSPPSSDTGNDGAGDPPEAVDDDPAPPPSAAEEGSVSSRLSSVPPAAAADDDSLSSISLREKIRVYNALKDDTNRNRAHKPDSRDAELNALALKSPLQRSRRSFVVGSAGFNGSQHSALSLDDNNNSINSSSLRRASLPTRPPLSIGTDSPVLSPRPPRPPPAKTAGTSVESVSDSRDASSGLLLSPQQQLASSVPPIHSAGSRASPSNSVVTPSDTAPTSEPTLPSVASESPASDPALSNINTNAGLPASAPDIPHSTIASEDTFDEEIVDDGESLIEEEYLDADEEEVVTDDATHEEYPFESSATDLDMGDSWGRPASQMSLIETIIPSPVKETDEEHSPDTSDRKSPLADFPDFQDDESKNNGSSSNNNNNNNRSSSSSSNNPRTPPKKRNSSFDDDELMDESLRLMRSDRNLVDNNGPTTDNNNDNHSHNNDSNGNSHSSNRIAVDDDDGFAWMPNLNGSLRSSSLPSSSEMPMEPSADLSASRTNSIPELEDIPYEEEEVDTDHYETDQYETEQDETQHSMYTDVPVRYDSNGNINSSHHTANRNNDDDDDDEYEEIPVSDRYLMQEVLDASPEGSPSKNGDAPPSIEGDDSRFDPPMSLVGQEPRGSIQGLSERQEPEGSINGSSTARDPEGSITGTNDDDDIIDEFVNEAGPDRSYVPMTKPHDSESDDISTKSGNPRSDIAMPDALARNNNDDAPPVSEVSGYDRRSDESKGNTDHRTSEGSNHSDDGAISNASSSQSSGAMIAPMTQEPSYQPSTMQGSGHETTVPTSSDNDQQTTPPQQQQHDPSFSEDPHELPTPRRTVPMPYESGDTFVSDRSMPRSNNEVDSSSYIPEQHPEPSDRVSSSYNDPYVLGGGIPRSSSDRNSQGRSVPYGQTSRGPSSSSRAPDPHTGREEEIIFDGFDEENARPTVSGGGKKDFDSLRSDGSREGLEARARRNFRCICCGLIILALLAIAAIVVPLILDNCDCPDSQVRALDNPTPPPTSVPTLTPTTAPIPVPVATKAPVTPLPTNAPTIAPSTDAPSNAPTTIRLRQFVTQFGEDISGAEAFTDRSTPQYQAAMYLIENDEFRIELLNVGELTDRYTLITLYYATNGPGWLECFADDPDCIDPDNGPWLQGSACQWFGIRCENGRVVDVVFSANNNLVGSLPIELSSMDQLQVFAIVDNRITGQLPETFLTETTTLQELILFDTSLTGTVPSGTFSRAPVDTVILQGNGLSGIIPPIGDPSTLSRLRLAGNQFTGAIPNYSSYQSLTVLELHDNRLEGRIPASLGDAAGLQEVNLSNNGLIGTIPASLGQLPQLRLLRFEGNDLSGSVSQDICARGLSELSGDCSEVTCSCCTECF